MTIRNWFFSVRSLCQKPYPTVCLVDFFWLEDVRRDEAHKQSAQRKDQRKHTNVTKADNQMYGQLEIGREKERVKG